MNTSKLSQEERNRRAKEKRKQWIERNTEHLREYSRKRRLNNIEKYRERSREYRRKNGDRIREMARKYRIKNKEKFLGYDSVNRQNPERQYKQFLKNAARRGLEFLLTLEYFGEYWGKPCCYCGSKIDTIGLDRVDNSLGYIVGNVVPCCYYCNWIKRDKTRLEFLEHCSRITDFQTHSMEY